MKICRNCKVEKPLAEFWKKAANSDGLDTRCKPCAYAESKKWCAKNREAVNRWDRGWRARNRGKVQEWNRKYNAENQEKNKERDMKHYAAGGLARSRKRKYGVTSAEVEKMLLTQSGACAICKVVPKEQLHVDHDHSSGRVRALLCRSCNLALGYLKDSATLARAAADYLDTFQQNAGEKQPNRKQTNRE